MKKILNTLGFTVIMTLPHTTYGATKAEILSMPCNGCHGPGGVSAGSSIPSIAGLERRYFMRTMTNFKKGERASTIMGRIARGYKVSDLLKISKHFSTQTWGNTAAKLDDEKILKGKLIHDELCEECHAENGKYQDHEIPRISGQVDNYLYIQMVDYRNGKEAMPQPDKMKERLITLKDVDLKALSDFYASGP